MKRAARSVSLIRSRGYPTPAWLAVGVSRAGYGYEIQELVPGSTRTQLTVGVAASLIEVLELQAGLDPDPDRSWSVYLADWYTAQWAATTPLWRRWALVAGRWSRPATPC